jgi:uncharacterized membrane protein
MPILLYSFLLGGFCGSRTMTPAAVLCWFAFVVKLPAQGTWFAFLASPLVVAILTTAMIAELIMDKLPIARSRLQPVGLIGRLCTGAFVGTVLATALLQSKEIGALLGSSGALIGALVGYGLRTGIVKKTGWPDYVVALIEDATAIAGSVAVVALALRQI